MKKSNKFIINDELRSFEKIKHIDDYGNEYWEARELQIVLEYAKWDKFINVINRAITSIKTEGSNLNDWLTQVEKPIISGKGKKEIIKDYKLSRYICYLIVQNADSSKKAVALGQKYFAVQTRKQELTESQYEMLSENEKRFYQRELTKQGNYKLQQVALKSGVKNMAEFHNAGYKGLYNGETADAIFKRKGFRYREDILDNMGEDELVANLFRINQTKQKLINDDVHGEEKAKETHFEVGKKVRKTIQELGGTMPDSMPTPNKSLKELERESKQQEVKNIV